MPSERENELIAAMVSLAGGMETRLSESFLTGLDKVKNNLDIETLEQYLQEGRHDLILTTVSNLLIEKGFAGFSAALTDAFSQGGKLAAKYIQPFTSNVTSAKVEVFFDVANPKLNQVLNAYKFDLITELTAEQLATTRQVLTRAIQQGINPKDAARDIRDTIGLTRRQDLAVENYKNLLLNGDRQALQRALRDKRFDPTISRAISENKQLSTEQVDKYVQRYRDRYKIYRSQTVARTEGIRALNQSSYQLWSNMVDEGVIEESRIKRFWIATNDNRTRPTHDNHRGIPKLNPEGVGMQEGFKVPGFAGTIMYPGDPKAPPALTVNCRCTVFPRIID